MRSKFPSLSEAKDYLLTAFLLVISIWLLISRNQGGIDNLRSASIAVYSYLELPLSKIRAHRHLAQRNKELRRQNIHLHNKLNRLRITKSDSSEFYIFKKAKADSLSLFPIQFVGKELQHANNVLTINAGLNDGLEVNMPVITSKGLVGKIVFVTSNYSEVMPYMNTLFKVSAKLQKSHAFGIVGWDGDRPVELQLKYVPRTIPVDSGEMVVTSGYGYQYPPNIPIGKVKRTESNKGRVGQLIYIDPAVNLYTITRGFVLTDMPDTTQKRLGKKYRKLFK